MNKTGKYRVLILTDHRIHSPVESIYSIARGLAQKPGCKHVHVVSRGIESNQGFFEHPNDDKLIATEVDDSFHHSGTHQAFQRNQFHCSPNDYDVAFLRLPRANSMEFFARIGKVIEEERIINQPQGIALTGSKEYLLNFPELCPPIRYCNSLEDVLEFRSRFPIVLKPLNSSGGKGIVRIEGDDVYFGKFKLRWKDFAPDFASEVSAGYLAMKFLKNVSQGDKRVIVINGQVVAAALRVPPEGSWICNVSMGATSVLAEPDGDEMEIARRVSPALRAEGVIMFGFDTLVDDNGKRVLSELNTSCVNGIYPADMVSPKPVVQSTVNLLWEYINSSISLKNEKC